MDIVTTAATSAIAIGDIVQLASDVATSGTLRAADLASDAMFELTVAVVVMTSSCIN